MSREEKKPSGRAAYPVGALFRLTVVDLLRTRRALLLLAVLLVPVAFSLYWSVAERITNDPLYLWGIIFVVAYLNFIVPFVALLYGATLVSGEREARTLVYLVTRPVPRWLIVLVKYAAAVVVCAVGVAASMLLAYGLLAIHFGWRPVLDGFRYWLRLSSVAGIALLVYPALFLFLGVSFRRPVVIGLIFIVLWEGFVGLIPGVIRFATIAHYLRSFAVYHASAEKVTVPQLFSIKEAPVLAAILVPAVLCALLLFLSLYSFTRAEFHTNPDRR